MEKVCNDPIKGGFWWYDSEEEKFYCKADNGELLAKISLKNIPEQGKSAPVQKLIAYARRLKNA